MSWFGKLFSASGADKSAADPEDNPEDLLPIDHLFALADADGDGVVNGRDAVQFFRKAMLPDETLKEVWRVSDTRKEGQLSKVEFVVAVRLVAAAQQGLPVSLDSLNILPDNTIPRLVDVDSPSSAVTFEVSIGSELKVTIPSTESRREGLSEYTVYQVCSQTTLLQYQSKDFHVWRRYSDFQWLQTALISKFPGMFVPPLPEKKVMGRLNRDFVENRRLALERFLNRVVSHTVLKTSYDVHLFLEASEDALKAVRKRAESGSYITTVFSDMASSMTRSIGGKGGDDGDLSDQEAFRRDIIEFGNKLLLFEAKARETTAVNEAYAEEMAQVAAGLVASEDSEDPILADAFKQLAAGVEGASMLLKEEQREENTKFAQPLKTLADYMLSVDAVYARREEIQANVDATTRSLESKEARLCKIKAAEKTSQSDVQVVEGDIERLKKKLEKLDNQQRMFDMALEAEIERFRSYKWKEFKEVFMDWAKLKHDYSERVQTLWEGTQASVASRFALMKM